MKIFYTIQNYFETLGIYTRRPVQKSPLNRRNVFVLFVQGIHFCLCIVFIIYEANTFEAYANTISTISTGITLDMEYMVQIWKMQKLFEFIRNFEGLIEKSEYYWKRVSGDRLGDQIMH